MLSKNRIQLVKSLHQRKYRKIHQQFIAEGPKLIAELLKSGWKYELILATEKWLKENDQPVKSEKIIEISEQDLLRISALKTPNLVLAVVHIAQPVTLPIQAQQFTLVLDQIKDPGNLGTIIRTADWFGVDQVICSPDCADIYNPKVVQATMGSVFRVKVKYTGLVDFFNRQIENQPVYGTFLDGENVFHSKITGQGIIVIGNESHGISENLLPFITHKIKIPDYLKGNQCQTESLNASIAAAIVMAEFSRKQMG